MSYTGWQIPDDVRLNLLELFPPKYSDVIAHHVTHQFPVPKDTLPPTETIGEIVGISDDHVGVQALIVKISDTTVRPDGGTYHITWSIDREAGRKPFHSNAVIQSNGWIPLDFPIPIVLLPNVFSQ